MINHYVYSKFKSTLLHPRYWLTWLGLIILYVLVLLPYPILFKLGIWSGRIAMPFMKYRVQIALRNLELCFPEMSFSERKEKITRNFESVGMGLIETGMAWFWPTWRIHRWCNVKGLEHIIKAQQEAHGILLIGLHFLTLELGARIFGIHNPGVGVYRPHNNKVIDWIQTWGRLRSNKYMLDRKNIKGMIRALKECEIVWYAPDHDYGPRSSVFVPLFAVEQAATTIGTYILARMSKPVMIPFNTIRAKDGSGYTMIIQPCLEHFPLENKIAAAAAMNKVVEQEILRSSDQYMWIHRRFKTRPKNMPSLY
ncbi:Lipid A biosynthesis lauroyltransferase [Candidatus Profftia lariciata]|uniref:Kdo(2)-lipid IV(A) acyltransferase n=1 Tax=Candidatus Profftia lariciata TaxID=1987921 RepID=UPI001D02E28C|nr:Kdo(2)-lipid IV(A) acyltransferase [Candidatus Profftia lariciata]UDG81343.1 Lipid A biosynthesis lauroyltransferase [Candidatus Profftia lariciata]